MDEKQIIYCRNMDELNDELSFNFKKYFLILYKRKLLIAKTMISFLFIFILLSFVLPKKYLVNSDLYINKSNNSNMAEINPYFISEVGTGSGMAALLSGGSGNLTNELEIIQSPLVIDKVIKENNLRFKKILGIFPTRKTGTYLTTQKFLEKNISLKSKKGTSVVTIEYTSYDKDLAYNIINSIINNYIQLHKEINTEKSKSDKTVLEAEYNKAKAELNKRMNSVSGIPVNTMTSTGNLGAMSAFSKSAQEAMSRLQGQYVSGIKSEIAIKEEAEKVAELAKKLEWAKLVDNMSDSSNVIILKEPRQLQDYEQASPKLFTNILLGIVFGIIGSLIAVIFKELTDKKLSYSMLDEEIIYDTKKEFNKLLMKVSAKSENPILGILFERTPDKLLLELREIANINFVNYVFSKELMNQIKKSQQIILFAQINKTSSEEYKQIKSFIKETKKEIIEEVLL